MKRWIVALRLSAWAIPLIAILAVSSQQGRQAAAEVGAKPQAGPVAVGERLGIVFISSLDVAQANYGVVPTYRYDRAASAGGRWNRWPFYWNEIEGSNGASNYTALDAVVNSDYAKGLQVNAILLGTPGWVTTGSATAPEGAPLPRVGEGQRYLGPVEPALVPASISPAAAPPRNLYYPVFSDGSDTPGTGKSINPNNYWARFVYNTVTRYKEKVKVWEMWNEPDHPSFWSGSASDYYRLLKVGYLAAKFADPSATVVMGGMAFWINQNFFGQLLGLIRSDTTAAANSYYFDVTAWHWYSRSSQMYDMVNYTRNILTSNGLGSKPIWVNETGVPIWDDPAKPPFGGYNSPYFASATQDEAASYAIQAVAYGLAANVQRIIYFQEYDDGNAEAFGLVRNNNTLRPSFTAYQVATQYLSSYVSAARATDGSVEKIIFYGTPAGKVTAIWNNSATDRYYSLPASGGVTRAYRVDKTGWITNLTLASSYPMFLSRATDNNGLSAQDYIIGGSPYLVVEEVPSPLPYTQFLPQVYKNGRTN